MNIHKEYEKLFEKALSSGLNDAEAEILNRHLDACAMCAEEFNELKNTQNLFRSANKHEPDPEFMNNFWEILEPKLSASPEKINMPERIHVTLSEIWEKIKSYLQFRFTWKYQLAGGMILLAAGIFIGRYMLSGSENNKVEKMTGSAPTVRTEYTLNETEQYLERSKVLLLGMMNYDPSIDDAETINLQHQQKISKDLLRKAAELKNRLKDVQTKNLISDIELILLQISNLELKNDLSGIELIQEGVNSRGIILKINIGEMKRSKDENNERKTKEYTGTKI